MKKTISILSVTAVSLFAFSCAEAESTPSIDNTASADTVVQQPQVINQVVSAEVFQEKMKLEGAQLVDVRTPDEVAGGKIDDASNIDYSSADFKQKMSELDKNKPVLVYCHSGGRSGRTAAMLKDMGFKEVYDLEGGYSNWPNK